MSEEAGEMARCRGAASLPDDDDLLREILVRLPPQPSSLVRASAVCKRWRGLVADPKFLQCFRAHHGKPPILGFFEQRNRVVVTPDAGWSAHDPPRFEKRSNIVFRPILDPPNRIPPERFDVQGDHPTMALLACRHGRVLVRDLAREDFFVCDPVTGVRCRLPDPAPEFRREKEEVHGVLLCAATDKGHVHGSCHSSPFKVVLMSPSVLHDHFVASVYSSETGKWGDFIPTMYPFEHYDCCHGILVGNVIHWLIKCPTDTDEGLYDIVVFDLDKESLAVIEGPPVTNDCCSCQIIQAEDGTVGVVVFGDRDLRMWQSKVDCHGVTTWLLQKIVKISTIIVSPPRFTRLCRPIDILGYDEDHDVIFFNVCANVYMLQLKSMQSRKLYVTDSINGFRPFTSFYTPGVMELKTLNGTKDDCLV